MDEVAVKPRATAADFIASSSMTRKVVAMRILVVEDEPKMRTLLRRVLVEERYAVDAAVDGPEALRLAQSAGFDAVLLDVMLPGADGFTVCGELRRQGVWAPVLMLTARDAVADRVRGLDGGADDYLTKPFALDELLARVRALVRRGPRERPVILQAGDLRLDPATRTVSRAHTEIPLTAKEYALLETLLRHPGMVLTRAMLLERCWDFSADRYSNIVDAHIKALRTKIDRPFGTDTIETVRGAGYRLRQSAGRAAGAAAP